MLKRITLTLLLIFPLLALAQENQPQPGIYCPHITRDLKFRDTDATTGGQVTELQKFLSDYYEDYPDWAITGNFRSTTRSYVQRFQREQNLPAFGYVGPLTRAAIARVCGTQTTPPPDNLPPPPPPQNQSCTTPWGGTIQNGTSVVAYQSPNVPQGQQCLFETRYCNNGTLTGSYQYQNCEVQANTTTSCTPLSPQTQTLPCPTGQTGAIIQTRTSSCPGPTWGPWVTTSNTCTTSTDNTQPPTVSLTVNGQQSITLTPGALFTLAWSSSNATSCNLTNAQNQTNPTTPNVSGSSQGVAPAAGQTHTYTLACTNIVGTTTKTASVTGATTSPPPIANVGSCIYKGQTYAEGQLVTSTPIVTLLSLYGNSFRCDNASWVVTAPSSMFPWTVGASICDGNLDNHDNVAWCNGVAIPLYPIGVAVQPRHGSAPLSVTMRNAIRSTITCQGFTVRWGDGSSESFPSGGNCSGGDGIDARTHTYTSPGSYVLSRTYDTGATHTANIRVDP